MTVDPNVLREPATALDPHPAYDQLRPHSPVRLGSRSWILLRHDHVRNALADAERFSSDVRAPDNQAFRDSPLVFDDPPRHGVLRGLVNKAFTPRRVAEAEPWVRSLVVELLDEAGPGPIEFVHTVADPLPVLVIARLLGVPDERHRQFKQWSNDRTHVIYHSRVEGPKSQELLDAEAGSQALTDLFVDLAVERRATPGSDLVSALASAQVDGESLSVAEVAGVCSVLLSAGNLTTTRLLTSLAVVLGGNPALLDAVRSDPAVRDALIEETLRLDSPVQMPIRRTTTDVELDGTTIPAGHYVTIGLGAANRDPAVFSREPLEPGVRGEPHLAFGHGIHYCLGAALARLEARVAIDVMAARFPSLALVDEPDPEPELAHGGYRRVLLSVS